MEKEVINLIIIDDEVDLAEGIQESLKVKEYTVSRVASGDEALKLLETTDVDCLLCDFNMPQMNGIEFANELRKQGLETPIILMTAFCEKDVLHDALRLGFFDLFEKPFDLLELIESLDKAIGCGVSRRSLCEELLPNKEDTGTFKRLDSQMRKYSQLRSLNYSKRT